MFNRLGAEDVTRTNADKKCNSTINEEKVETIRLTSKIATECPVDTIGQKAAIEFEMIMRIQSDQLKTLFRCWCLSCRFNRICVIGKTVVQPCNCGTTN